MFDVFLMEVEIISNYANHVIFTEHDLPSLIQNTANCLWLMSFTKKFRVNRSGCSFETIAMVF